MSAVGLLLGSRTELACYLSRFLFALLAPDDLVGIRTMAADDAKIGQGRGPGPRIGDPVDPMSGRVRAARTPFCAGDSRLGVVTI
jgi:hypothetical protein